MSMSNPQYSQTNTSVESTGHIYEVATSAMAGKGYPDEIPVPLASSNGGSD